MELITVRLEEGEWLLLMLALGAATASMLAKEPEVAKSIIKLAAKISLEKIKTNDDRT